MSGNAKQGGIGLSGLVFIVFLVMKLAGIGAVAGWSWWWVTCPLWIPLVLSLGIGAGILAVAAVGMAVAGLVAFLGSRR